MSLLDVKNVSRHFGSLVAVRDISMSVEAGELRAVIGPNGAGKTTFFNLISGFLTPTSGRILFENEDITNLLPARRVWRGIARTFQVTEVFPELSVRENLRIAVEAAAGFRLRPWISRVANAEVSARVTDLSDMGGLSDKENRPVGELSHGDQRAHRPSPVLDASQRAVANAARRESSTERGPCARKRHPENDDERDRHSEPAGAVKRTRSQTV